MTNVRRHRRKGHRRKDGTWVRGSTVRAHHRKGSKAVPKRSAQRSTGGTILDMLSKFTYRPSTERSRVAGQICDLAWQARVIAAASQAAGPQTWSARPRHCRRSDCSWYAKVANRLLDVRVITSERLANLAISGLPERGRKAFAPLLARCLVVSSPLPSDQALTQAARCLRALGVLCCVAAGRDMARCPCLRVVASDLTSEALSRELRQMATATLWSPTLPGAK